MKCANFAVGHAKDDYWLASDLPATIFGQKFSSARNQMLFLSIHVLLSLINLFNLLYRTAKIAWRRHTVVTFRTKNWMDEQKVVVDSLQTMNFIFPAVTWKNIVSSFPCRGNVINTLQCKLLLRVWKFVSTRTPSVFLERESCACFRINYLFFDLQLFSIVNWLW